MLAAIHSAAVLGIDAYDVIVEVDATQGLPQWTIVGLPVGAVKESRERVGSALVNSGFVLPPRRITVNLAPADVRKEGTAFDLPIALGILVATGQLPPESMSRRVFVGELGLDGSVRGIRGALSIARRAAANNGHAELVIPRVNLGEAGRVKTLRLVAPEDLRSLAAELSSGELSLALPCAAANGTPQNDLDFSDVVGQNAAKRALEDDARSKTAGNSSGADRSGIARSDRDPVCRGCSSEQCSCCVSAPVSGATSLDVCGRFDRRRKQSSSRRSESRASRSSFSR